MDELEKLGQTIASALGSAVTAHQVVLGELSIITTNCGSRVDHLGAEKMKELFAELETYGVRHDDAEMRNVTYRAADGRFCLIDFEFATLLGDDGTSEISLKPHG